MGNVQWPFKVRATDIVSRHTNKPPAQIVNWQVVPVSFPPHRYHIDMPCRYLSIVLAVRALIFFFHLAYLSCDVDLWPQDNNHLANETLTKTRTKTKAQYSYTACKGCRVSGVVADLHDVRRPLSDSVGVARDLSDPRPDEKRSQSDVGESEERVKRLTVS